jgi:hypothetical protein
MLIGESLNTAKTQRNNDALVSYKGNNHGWMHTRTYMSNGTVTEQTFNNNLVVWLSFHFCMCFFEQIPLIKERDFSTKESVQGYRS